MYLLYLLYALMYQHICMCLYTTYNEVATKETSEIRVSIRMYNNTKVQYKDECIHMYV